MHLSNEGSMYRFDTTERLDFNDCIEIHLRHVKMQEFEFFFSLRT